MTREHVILGVVLYFVACSGVACWWLVPDLRARVSHRLAHALAIGRNGAAGGRLQPVAGAHAGRGAWHLGDAPAAARVEGSHGPSRWWVLSLALLMAAPGLAWLGRQWHGYDGFDHTASRAVNTQVAALLDGEQLAPPAPLPPEFFLTREVLAARPMVATASRQWELLDAEFRQRLLAVFKLMREKHNIEMVLIEGYRSPERQAALAALGPGVTHAGAERSYHQHGLAADCAFLVDGRIVISEQDARAARGYELYGELAQSFGLVWGGGWRSLKDLGHVELRRAGVMDAPAREDNKQ